MKEVPIHKYGLTQSQAQGYDEIVDWYNDKNSNIHILSGYAGTGKTYLLQRLITNLFNKNVCVTAPTHRALRILETVTGKTGLTIQALNGLRPNMNLDDFRIDQMKFDRLGEQKMRLFKVIITDEASMLNSDLETLMSNNAKNFGIKLLYVGDPCQLPPIKEPFSPVFMRHKNTILTDIIRQTGDNPIKTLLEISRDDVLNNTSNFMKFLETYPIATNNSNEGYSVLSGENFSSSLISIFQSEDFLRNPSHCRYLGFTNESINIYNKFIRDNTINSNKIVTKDDLLTGYKTIVNEYNETIIVNSEDYLITDIVERISDFKYKVFQVSLFQISTGITTRTNIVDHTDDSFINYVIHITDLINNTIGRFGSDRGRAYKQYFQFKDNNLTLINFEITDEEGKIHKVYKELDYGYGLTVHKAQGSTITNPFINLIDMCYYSNGGLIKNTPKNPNAVDFRNRLVYTALTRTSKKVSLLL